jgi:hypothetical protein
MDPFSLAVLGGINLGLGGLKSAQAAKQRKQEMMTRAAEIEASPWTGRGPSTQVVTASLNPWAELAGGALNTLSQAAELKKSGLLDSSEKSPTIAEGELDKNLNIGGQSLSPQSQAAAEFMGGQAPEISFNRSLAKSLWDQMPSSLRRTPATLYSSR